MAGGGDRCLFLAGHCRVLLPPLWRSRNRRNLVFPFILLALAGANLVIHLQALGMLASGSDRALQFTLNAVTLILVVIGGRVIPVFTANALPRSGSVAWSGRMFSRSVWSSGVGDRSLPISVCAYRAGGVTGGGGEPHPYVALAIPATRRVPVLWILHLGYAWIVVALPLKGLAGMVPVVTPSGRSCADGRCDRQPDVGHDESRRVGSHWPYYCGQHSYHCGFILINAGAIIRVVIPIAVPVLPAGAHRGGAVMVERLCAVCHSPYPHSVQPRIDGKPG